MTWLLAALFLAGGVPLWFAWRRCAGTSLEHATLWLAAAWAGWGLALFVGQREASGWEPWRFVALAVTCCPIVAVLGARRPYYGAWNFVVLGLLTVLLLPLFEMLVLGSQTLDGLRLFFLGATLAIGVLNYLPTRFGLGAAWVGVMLGLEFAVFAFPRWDWLDPEWVHAGLLASPMVVVFSGWRSSWPTSAFDRTWLEFRDRYGVVWAQRVREQFNRAAANAGWQIKLGWNGLVGDGSKETQAEACGTLDAVLTRFVGQKTTIEERDLNKPDA